MATQDIFDNGRTPMDQEAVRIVSEQFPHLATAVRDLHTKLGERSDDGSALRWFASDIAKLTLFGARENGRLTNVHKVDGKLVDISQNRSLFGESGGSTIEGAVRTAENLRKGGLMPEREKGDSLEELLERNKVPVTPEIKKEMKELGDYATHPKKHDHVQDGAIAMQKALELHQLPEVLKNSGITYNATHTAAIYAHHGTPTKHGDQEIPTKHGNNRKL